MDAGQTVVVGVDASPAAHSALNWAREHAARDDIILAVHAWDEPLFVSAWVPQAIFTHDFERMAGQVLSDAVAACADDPRLTPVLRRGRPGPQIVAEASEADLIVVGHRSAGRMSMLFGSSASYVLHHATTPVVVVRGQWSTAFGHVVVGVDAQPDTPDDDSSDESSDESITALRWALRLPGLRRLTVVHAWARSSLEAALLAGDPDAEVEWNRAAEATVARAIERAGELPPGVVVESEIARSHAVEALVERSTGADLVVVGTRGRGGFAGLVLGSTSIAVVAASHAPVAVVR